MFEALPISVPMLALVCFLIGMGAFVDAVAGGGGLISLPAYLFAGLPVHTAMGCNKFSASVGTTFAAASFLQGRALHLRTALLAAAGSFAGGTIASRLALLIPDSMLRLIVLIGVPTAAVVIFSQRKLPDDNRFETLPPRRAVVLAVVIGFLIGLWDGLVGPGTGTFAIIAFSMLMKFDLTTSSGNAKVLNLASNYASLLTFVRSGDVIYAVAIPAAVCGVIGSLLGSRMAIKGGAKMIRPMLLLVLALLLAKMAADIFL